MMTTILHPKTRPLLLIAAAIGGLIILAAGFSQFQLEPGESFPYQLIFSNSSPTPVSGEATPDILPETVLEFVTMLALFLLTLVLILWLIVFIIRPQARKRMLQRIAYYLVLLLLMHTILGYVRQLQPLENPTAGAESGAIGEPLADSPPLPAAPAFVLDPPRWLVFMLSFALISLLLLAVWFFLSRRSVPPSFSDGETPITLMVQEVQDTLTQLQHGANFKDSVLGCYQAMTHILQEERGIQRQQTMTPRDFEAHLHRVGLQDEHIRRLTRLFEKVRYGFGEPAAQDETEAVDCLTAIVQTYSRSA